MLLWWVMRINWGFLTFMFQSWYDNVWLQLIYTEISIIMNVLAEMKLICNLVCSSLCMQKINLKCSMILLFILCTFYCIPLLLLNWMLYIPGLNIPFIFLIYGIWQIWEYMSQHFLNALWQNYTVRSVLTYFSVHAEKNSLIPFSSCRLPGSSFFLTIRNILQTFCCWQASRYSYSPHHFLLVIHNQEAYRSC